MSDADLFLLKPGFADPAFAEFIFFDRYSALLEASCRLSLSFWSGSLCIAWTSSGPASPSPKWRGRGTRPCRGWCFRKLEGGVIGSAGGYAYVVDWRDLNAPRLLSTLLAQDVRVRVAFSPFTGRTASGEVDFERGALVIPTAGQSIAADLLRTAVDEAARDAGVAAHTLVSGQSVTGVDLGSEQIRPVEKPQIALVMGDGVNAAEIGSVWFASANDWGGRPLGWNPSNSHPAVWIATPASSWPAGGTTTGATSGCRR